MKSFKFAGVLAGAALIAAAAIVGVTYYPASVRGGDAPIRKVVLITIDTLRADRLGLYGYPKPTSPTIDAFAKEGLVFERAMAPAPWTAPALAAMITGRYPYETGVYTNQNNLPPKMGVLATTLGEAGLATGWFNTNPVLMLGTSQFNEGFKHVAPAVKPPVKVPYSTVEPDLFSWLDQHAAGDFFAWIHSMDPHSPPTEGNPYHKDKSWHVYDAEIRHVDDAMGRLFGKLKALGVWDETLIIFTADHGEAFSEHMLPGHQNVIYDEVLHIPLIIRYPGMKNVGRTREPVELIDLYRTIAELARVEVPKTVRGESLVPILEARAAEREHDYLFHSRYYLDMISQHHLAVRDREYKLIAKVPFQADPTKRLVQQPPVWSLDQPGTTLELYRYADDPREKLNLIFNGADPQVAERLKQQLLEWRDRIAGREQKDTHVELDDKTRDTLKQLGY